MLFLLVKAFSLQRWQSVFLAVGNRIIGALVLTENFPECLNEQSRAQEVILIFNIREKAVRECGQCDTNALKCIKTCFLAYKMVTLCNFSLSD